MDEIIDMMDNIGGDQYSPGLCIFYSRSGKIMLHETEYKPTSQIVKEIHTLHQSNDLLNLFLMGVYEITYKPNQQSPEQHDHIQRIVHNNCLVVFGKEPYKHIDLPRYINYTTFADIAKNAINSF